MDELKKKKFRNMKLKTAKRLILAITIVLIFDFILFPAPILASESADLDNEVPIIEYVLPTINNVLPDAEDLKVNRETYRTITAYNSEIGQTDSEPCITASGFDLCANGQEDSAAANWLPFGAKIRIPELFGDRVFIVRDRMNGKYSNRLDIWMLEKADAKKFGVRVALIEILDH